MMRALLFLAWGMLHPVAAWKLYTGVAGPMLSSQRGNIGMGTIVSLVVALIVVAYLAPVGLEALMAVDTSEWDAAVSGLWILIPIMAIVGLVFFVWRKANSGGGGD